MIVPISEIDTQKQIASNHKNRYENQRYIVNILKDLIKTPLKVNLFDHLFTLITSWYELTFIDICEFDAMESKFTFLNQSKMDPKLSLLFYKKILYLPAILNPLNERQMKLIYDLEGIKSIFLIPLFINEGFFGVMVLANENKYISWNAEEINLLSMVAAIINEFLFQETQLSFDRNKRLDNNEISSFWAQIDSKFKEKIYNRYIHQQICADFIRNTSHQARNSLNAIIGFSSLLYESVIGKLDPEQQAISNDILVNGNIVKNWIGELEKIINGADQSFLDERMEMDLSILFNEIRTYFQYQVDLRKIILKTETVGQNPRILGNPTLLTHFITSILNRFIQIDFTFELLILKYEIQNDFITITIQNDQTESFVNPYPFLMDLNNSGAFNDFIFEMFFWKKQFEQINSTISILSNSSKKIQLILRMPYPVFF